MISPYSLITAIIFYNAVLVFIWLTRRNQMFLARCGTQMLVTLAFLGIVRLFTPIDHQFSYIVQSDKFIPAIQGVISYTPLSTVNITIGHLLVIVWLLGSLIYIARFCIGLNSAHRMYMSFDSHQDDFVQSIASELGIKNPVVVSQQIQVPHVAGILKPTIYLPALDLTKNDWQFVLLHEWQHLRSRDLTIKLFYHILAAIFWWNPISHAFVREIDNLLELRCDYNIVKNLDESEKVSYLATIINIVKQTRRPVRAVASLGSGLFQNENIAKQRFEMVLDFDPRKFRKIRTVLIIFIVLIFLLSYCLIFQPVYYPPMEEVENTLTVTSDTSFILFDGQNYSMYIDNEFFGFITEDQLNTSPYSELPIIGGSE